MRTDRQTGVKKLTVTFRKFGKAPKNANPFEFWFKSQTTQTHKQYKHIQTTLTHKQHTHNQHKQHTQTIQTHTNNTNTHKNNTHTHTHTNTNNTHNTLHEDLHMPTFLHSSLPIIPHGE